MAKLSTAIRIAALSGRQTRARHCELAGPLQREYINFRLAWHPGGRKGARPPLLLLGRLQQDGVGRSAPYRHAAPGHADLDLLGWDEHGRTCIDDEVLIADLITDTIQQFRQR